MSGNIGMTVTVLGLMVFLVVGAYVQCRWIERQVGSAIKDKPTSK